MSYLASLDDVCVKCTKIRGQHNRDQINLLDYCTDGTGNTFFPSSVTKVKGLSPDQPTTTNEAGGKQSSTPYRLDLIPPLAILRESEVLAGGAIKYGENNWKRIPISDHLNHILQHIYAYLAGDRSDDHLANLACRAHFALELQEEAKNNESTGGFTIPDICIDCKGSLSPVFYGAGDGTGQKFRCAKCYELYETHKSVKDAFGTI